MLDLAARAAAIAVAARAAAPGRRQANRDADPDFAAWVDEMRRVFGARLTYVRWADGREWGQDCVRRWGGTIAVQAGASCKPGKPLKGSR